jgi:hypothetical protein
VRKCQPLLWQVLRSCWFAKEFLFFSGGMLVWTAHSLQPQVPVQVQLWEFSPGPTNRTWSNIQDSDQSIHVQLCS